MSSEPTRPSTSKRLAIQCLAIVAVAGAGYGIYRFASKILRQDPLKSYKTAQEGELPEAVAMQSTDAVFNHFEEGKPKASCNVKTMEVAQNRQIYNFRGITNGKLQWKDDTYGFSADQGTWNGFIKKMQLSGNLKLKGKKIDLKSKSLTYDEPRRTFVVPEQVVGTAYGGKLVAANFEYDLDRGNFRAGKGEWMGIPPSELQDTVGVQDKKSTWKFNYEDLSRTGDIMTFTNARATDGEVIVKAPKIERNTKTDVLTATGRVQYFSPKANLIADKVVVYRKEKRAVLTGNVTMLVKPKIKENDPVTETELSPLPPAVPESISSTRPPAPDDDQAKKTEDQIRSTKNLRDYPLSITAPAIEYWYKKGERHAKITGNPQARQEMPDNGWRYVWSHHANYDGEKEMLYLFSSKDTKGIHDVIMKNSLGDEFYGNSGELSTKEGDDTYHFSDGKGVTTTDDEDLPKSGGDKKSGSGNGTGGGKGGGGLSGPIGRKV